MKGNLFPPILALLVVVVSGVSAVGGFPSLAFNERPDVLRRALHSARVPGRSDKPKNSTNIARSWDGATLFSIDGAGEAGDKTQVTAGVEVTCTTCYVKGSMTTQLEFDDDFDIVQAVGNFTTALGDEIENITTTVIDYLDDQVPALTRNLTDDLDFDDVDLPPLNFTLNRDIPDIPDCRLHFEFDELELYLLLDTTLSAGTSYTLNLYSSNTLLGLSVDSENFLGIILSIDLMLAADAEIDISSGLHIQIDDGMALDLALFSKEVSSVTFNGGSFEFLPVKVQSANGVLTAKLRVGLHAGVSIHTDESLGPFLSASAGAGVLVYADLAEFTTTITAGFDEEDDLSDGDCQLRVQQAYQLALGAEAGATVAIGPETWGPDPSTSIPIFYTTLADECIHSAPATTTESVTRFTPTVAARADTDMTTTTLTSEVVLTGVVCLATAGPAGCPATLQATTKVTRTTIAVVTVSAGSEASFRGTIQDVVRETIPFVKNVKAVAATSGPPVSYVPPPPTPTLSPSAQASPDPDPAEPPLGKVHGVDTRLVVGLSVGLGVPFLAAVATAAYFFFRRWRYTAVPRFDAVQVASPQDSSYAGVLGSSEKKSNLSTSVTVMGHS
ncbi:hypothetical protein GGS20DRAFT_579742 [Poronia punctata]|nr:hypothetical protein GGS20DRAFT_579742 [Poronia punctata]